MNSVLAAEITMSVNQEDKYQVEEVKKKAGVKQ